ncbi:MAG: hypothetical protein A2286_10800 [Gammaproteobacteria bacterium RIFOXYA12_FULL_61_12]|nr:MAG: hypothetical protein A2286_10800 [Gammaproteobacteria bacterium RIFOXYA12_FULL_61_12]
MYLEWLASPHDRYTKGMQRQPSALDTGHDDAKRRTGAQGAGRAAECSPRPRLPRFILLAAVPLTLLSLTFVLYCADLLEQLHSARLELQGVEYARKLQHTNMALARLRGLTRMRAAGDVGVESQIAVDRVSLEAELADVLADPAGEAFGLHGEVLEIERTLWQELDRPAAPDSFARLTAQIDRLRELLLRTAERSRLLLDPDIDGYYLVTLLVDRVPSLIESIGQLRGLGAGFHVAGAMDREQLSLVERRVEGIRHDMAVVGRMVRALQQAEGRSIEQRFDASRDHIEQFLAASLAIATGKGPDSLLFFELGSEAISLCRGVCREARALLVSLLEHRIDRLRTRLGLGAAAFTATLALVLFLFAAYYRGEGRFIRRLQELATVDPLTGAGNRRAFDEALARQIETADRYDRAFSVVAFDIDCFKEINDMHGHEAGDGVIRRLAGIARETIRHPIDRVYRTGGDEFHLLLPETDLAGAQGLAERFRAAMAENPFDDTGPASISLGVAQYRRGEILCDLLKRADIALYLAKRDGRNRVVASPEEPPA